MSACLDQRQTALAEANRIRLGIADVKALVKPLSSLEGCVFVADLLDEPSDAVAAMRIGLLLSSVRKMGSRKAGRMLLLADVRSYDRRVRDLSPRQRSVLADALRFRAGLR